MKKYIQEINNTFLIYCCWTAFLLIVASYIAPLIPIKTGFLSESKWANFDGVHYVSIAKYGYHQYEHAFFPLYPYILKLLSFQSLINSELVALVFSRICTFILLFCFIRVLREYKRSIGWNILFLLTFPTSFYLFSAYNESLYITLFLISVLLLKHKKYVLASIFGFFSSLTRLFGIFMVFLQISEVKKMNTKMIHLRLLFIFITVLGFATYTLFLYRTTGSPITFLTAQNAFNNGRSSSLVFPMQTIWRYGKIVYSLFSQGDGNLKGFSLLFNFSPSSLQYWTSLFELYFFCLSCGLLWKMWKIKHFRHFFYYSVFVIFVPTATGTFQSLPRYLLSAIPVFFILDEYSLKTRIYLITSNFMLLCFTTALFLRGYFVS